MADNTYQQLSKQFTPEELAESYVFPHELSEIELAEAQQEMKRLRFQLLQEQTEQQKIYSNLIRLKLLIQDYLAQEHYSNTYSFGHYLAEYIHLIRRSRKTFAQDISLHYTKLSRLINDKEDPNIDLFYRLEAHSDQLLPAILWWKLHMKKQAHLILTADQRKKEAAQKVSNKLQFS